MKIRRLMLVKNKDGQVLDLIEDVQYIMRADLYRNKYKDAEVYCLVPDNDEAGVVLTCNASFISPITFFLFKAGTLSTEAIDWLVTVLNDEYSKYALLYNLISDMLTEQGISDSNVDIRLFKNIFKEHLETVLDSFQDKLEGVD